MDDREYDLMVQGAKKYGDALTELGFAKSRIEALEKALRPFARVIEEKVTGDFSDDHPAWGDAYSPLVKDFKRAYELVGEKKDGQTI